MTQNPFGFEDVPEPDGGDVAEFAATVRLSGSDNDPNAANWADVPGKEYESIEGRWSSRWRGDGPDWHVGHGELQLDETGDRVYILFDWDEGAKQGLIEAHREGADRLAGRYANLSTPGITPPWVGLIVETSRIDGKHPFGRIDFRRSTASSPHRGEG